MFQHLFFFHTAIYFEYQMNILILLSIKKISSINENEVTLITYHDIGVIKNLKIFIQKISL